MRAEKQAGIVSKLSRILATTSLAIASIMPNITCTPSHAYNGTRQDIEQASTRTALPRPDLSSLSRLDIANLRVTDKVQSKDGEIQNTYLSGEALGYQIKIITSDDGSRYNINFFDGNKRLASVNYSNKQYSIKNLVQCGTVYSDRPLEQFSKQLKESIDRAKASDSRPYQTI